MKTAREKGSAADERWHQRKDGSRFYMSGVMQPIYDQGLQGYVKVARDMTKQQLFTEELHKLVGERTAELQRSNEDLQQFAHAASHDLREPVRKITTFKNRILKEDGDHLPEFTKLYLEKMETATNRMFSMIDGLLNYSKIANTEQVKQDVDLADILNDIIVDLELPIQQKKATISHSNMPVIKGYKVLLYQLFYNLILNSLKFSNENVLLEISVTAAQLKEAQGMPYRIIYTDNGIGFEEEFNESIFNSFSRLNSLDKYEGTGLGLSLCKKIVLRHNGSISASGRPGSGAVFTILLPADVSSAT